jgi:hypothetical protein
MGLKLGDLSPVYGAIKGEGMFGDLLGKKSENAAKIAADKAKADEAEAKKAEQAAKNTATLRSQGMGGGMGMKKGGKVSSASKRADGIATKGKTRGRMV